MVLAMSTWFSAAAVLPQFRARLGLSPAESSLLTIAVQVGFVLGALVSATFNLSDVLPPRRLMLAGAAGAAGANALLATGIGTPGTIALRCLTGVFLAWVYPPGLKSMATWFRRSRGTALGVMVGALTIGSAVPHLVNGLGGANWRVVVMTTSVLTLAGGVIAEFGGSDGPFPFPRASFDPRQALRVFRDRGVRLATLGYFGHMWELYAMWAWFLVFFAAALERRGIASADQFAAFVTFAVISIGALGCWVGGILGDRWGRARTTVLSMVISGACAVLIGLVYGGPIPLVLAVGLLWGFAVVADSAQFSTIVTEISDQSYVGTALTVQLATGFTLTVLTIWLVPVLRDQLGWQWAFTSLALGPALGVLAMLRLMQAPEARRIAGGRG